MVDASIGGKNGIDVGPYKNMVGTTRQPSFILQDISFLRSLSVTEWSNGFAEIIKHACILDRALFRELEKRSISLYRKDQRALRELIKRNAALKIKIVQKDEFEKNLRMILNFGHTLGHALENQYDLTHGQAISIGMGFATELSARLQGFKDTDRVIALLNKYDLPAHAQFNKKKVFDVLKMDKKRQRKEINYVLLKEIGSAVVTKIPLRTIQKNLDALV
jgi:3-dehydroquinate synthase